MTCIIGIEHDNGVLIGGDSAGSAGYQKRIRADEKVFTVGPYVMGFTSSFRMGQLLRYRLNVVPPGTDDLQDLDSFIATTFIDTVRQTLKEGGFTTINNNQEEGGDFLLGIAGCLYEIGSDFQFGRNTGGYAAVGCGDDLALGSLHTTAQYDFFPYERAEHALEAAAAFSGMVAAPFTIIDAPSDFGFL
jgi:hypothetical protein